MMTRNTLWLAYFGCVGMLALPACGGTCGDDGWAWLQSDNQACVAASATEASTEASTDAATEATTVPTTDPTQGATTDEQPTQGSATQGSATQGGGLWCADEDGDGFGDPDKCQDQQFPGAVENDGDCDDGDADTFPGAAEHESAEACMKDSDGDGWGDNNPGPGVEPGTDCDDGNQHAYPGAAEKESADACMQDADGDGFGDSDPGPGIEPGTDCDDTSEHTFPGAAPNDDPEACMKDVDGDDWGDLEVPRGVAPGTDCDDTSSTTFPGAAPNNDPEACMKDDDGDDWGDADPPTGVLPGTDCDDADATIHVDCVACEPVGVTQCVEDTLLVCGPGGNVSDSEVCAHGCDPVALKCLDELTVDAGPSVCIDPGQSVQLGAVAMGGDGSYSWDWTPANSLDDPKIADPMASPANATTYTVTVTDGVNNVAEDKVTVFIKDAALVLDDVACKITNFKWGGVPNVNWSWNPNLVELCQLANSTPTARFCGWALDNASIQGRFQVKTASDDDYIGFLWGIQPFNQLIEEPRQFYFFSWKQGNQLGFCPGVPTSGRAGMLVKRIDVADPLLKPLTCADFHSPEDTDNAKVLATEAEFATVGWLDNVAYTYELVHTPKGFTVRIIRENNNTVIAEKDFEDATFPNGQVGFYAYSQEQSCFSNFKTSCL